jgi:putative peptidoglycan lipid II flippase
VNLLKAASAVSVMTLASRVTGLVRELLMASTFGSSALTDAFNVAFRIPNLLRRLFAEGAFSQAFVPVLASTRSTEGEKATKDLIDAVAVVLCWALLLTCSVGVVGAPVLVWVMASGLQSSSGAMDAAVFMTRCMFPYIACMSLVALSAGVLNTYKRFVLPAATPVLLNVAMIAAAWQGAPLFARWGIEPMYAMAAGVMLGGLLQLGFQVPLLLRLGLLPRVSLRWSGLKAATRTPGIGQILSLMFPALLGVSVAQISLIINTQIASHLGPGSVSWLSYADRLMEFPIALLGVALGVVLTPQMAAAKASADTHRYGAMIDWGLRWVVLLGLPCAVALVTFAQPLVTVLFHYGAFSARDVLQTAPALMGYGCGLIGLVAVKVLASAFYAQKDTRSPMRVALVVLVLTQVMNAVFVPLFKAKGLGHAGLALSIGLGGCLNALLLWVLLVRKGEYRPAPGWGRFLLQAIAASALLAVFLLWVGTAISWLGWQHEPVYRLGLLVMVVLTACALYFSACMVAGLSLKAMLKPSEQVRA